MNGPWATVVRTGSGAPLYQQVAREIERIALEREVGDEDPLPPEWSLMQRFGVSRGTLRRAIAELERRGLLLTEPGRGTFVNPAARLRRVVWERLARVARPDSRFHLDFSNFVPDFEGSEEATRKLRALPEYRRALMLFVAPDNNLEEFRALALADGKRLVVATHAIQRGFVLLEAASVPPERRELAATLDGMERAGRTLSLGDLRAMDPIDLVVSGAAAVSREGVHFGKGHGYLDLEWGLLRELNLVTGETPVVVSVHECQVIPERVPHAPYDVTADVIVTPRRIIRCRPSLPKPPGLFWDRISAEAARSIPYLADLLLEASEVP